MDARFNYQGNAVAAKFAKYINSAGAVVSNSTLSAATQELVKIRASQINGCAACADMYTKDAEHAGLGCLRDPESREAGPGSPSRKSVAVDHRFVPK